MVTYQEEVTVYEEAWTSKSDWPPAERHFRVAVQNVDTTIEEILKHVPSLYSGREEEQYEGCVCTEITVTLFHGPHWWYVICKYEKLSLEDKDDSA